MEKEFIPYEEALALKELGFDETCFKQYSTLGQFIVGKCTIPAPLYQQVFRWFREKHELKHIVEDHIGEKFYSKITWLNNNPTTSINSIIIKDTNWAQIEFDSYEGAELQGLRDLIKLVKELK